MLKVIEKLNDSKLIYWAILALILGFLIYTSSFSYFWYDEAFTLHLCKHTFTEIWNLTAVDVHPPLYYFLLKIHLMIFGNSLFAARIFSAIPIFLTFLLACTQIRKLWGNKAATSFMILLAISYHTLFMGIEIRMYSWSAFLVLLTFVYAYKAYHDNKLLNVAIFFIASLMAAYMHYYALLSVFYIYVAYFIFLLRTKEKKRIYLFLGLGLLFFLLYLPWLSILFYQMGTLDGHWIKESDSDIQKLVLAIHPADLLHDWPLIFRRQIKYLLYLPIILMFILAKRNTNKRVYDTALLIFLLFVAPNLTGMIISHIYHPIFFPRYALCSLFLYFLSFALFFSVCDFKHKTTKILTNLYICVLILVSYISFSKEFYRHKNESIARTEAIQFINETRTENSIFLYRDSLHTAMATYTLIFPENRHVSKIDSMGYHYQILKVMGDKRTRIKSYQDLDTMIYDRVFILNDPTMAQDLYKHRTDSAAINKLFELSREYQNPAQSVYELRRKRTEEAKSDTLSIE